MPTFDNVTASTSTSFSHTCTGSDLTLVAIFKIFSQASNSVTASPTYNGVSLTQVPAASVENFYTTNRYLNEEIWYLDNPATGSNTFSWSTTGTAVRVEVTVLSYTGANNGIGSSVGTSTGNSSGPTATFTTDNSGGMVVGGALVQGGDTDPFSPGTGVTERADGATGTSTAFDFGYTDGELTATGGSDTIAFTASVADEWAISAIEINAAAAGADYTLTADAGSYTVTGQTAGLLASRLLSAEQGSYTVSGQAASLLVNRLLTAETGAFTLSGNDAVLLTSRLLTANSGSFMLTGLDAALTYNSSAADYTLTAESGSYSLTGQSANLLVNRLLTASAGAYVVTGQDASLLASRLLTAESGSYTIAGQDASLLISRLLTAVTGSYALTGQDVTFIYAQGVDTPADRILIIAGEDRILAVALDNRTLAIVEDGRTLAIDSDSRNLPIPHEDRVLAIGE